MPVEASLNVQIDIMYLICYIMNIMIAFNEVVRQWRLARGLTQEVLAHRAGVPRPNLCAIERGRRDVSLTTLRALAVGLGVRPGVLADGTPPGADEDAAVWSRRALDRVAEAVVRGVTLSNKREQEVVEGLRQVVASRLQAMRHRSGPRSPRSHGRQAGWIRLQTRCSPHVLQSLLERIEEQQGVVA